MPISDSDKGWVYYSSLGLEMAVMVGLCVFGGVKADSAVSWHFPVFTILGAALGLTLSLLYLFKKVK